jgi:pimeloyl-ACP methyl ester carboxylesterase
MWIRLALTAGLALGTGAAPAGAASGCDNMSGQHCLVRLSTGVRMSYFDLGAARGTVLILLHTDTTGAIEWTWTVAALLRMDPQLHIYALDQRGAGATGLPDTARCWSTPNMCITDADRAADLLAFMNAKRIPRATLVGHAMGAAAARLVALDHPERVERLILSGTAVPRAAHPPQAQPDVMEPLGWRALLEAKGVPWPQGALHMRPLDIDPDAVRNIAQHWDISAIAPAQVVEVIAAQSAGQSLASWGTLDPTPAPPAPAVLLDRLSVPTLVLWGSEDAGLPKDSQQRLIDTLRLASATHRGMYFYWKQYGVRPPPASGDKHAADDIGHNLSWEAPRQLAADIDSFVRTGAPTRDLYRTDAPADIHHILVVPGEAVIVSSMPQPRG